mmetsp:Transcript_2862/g.8472  ORF Transcript_2862/g.8472 Transcript_2862/m.8472 type:complete len:221 (+) Transcript_2862:285-947(+)
MRLNDDLAYAVLAFAGEDAEPRAACLNKFWARLRRVWVYEQSEESLWTVTFSPCGRTLATGGTDNKAKLYDVASGNLRREIVRTSSVDAVEFSPDGAWIAVGGRDSNAALYDVATFSLQLEFQSHNWVSSLAFSPDSASLAMKGRSEREICLYYVETGDARTTAARSFTASQSHPMAPRWLRRAQEFYCNLSRTFASGVCSVLNIGHGSPPWRSHTTHLR